MFKSNFEVSWSQVFRSSTFILPASDLISACSIWAFRLPNYWLHVYHHALVPVAILIQSAFLLAATVRTTPVQPDFVLSAHNTQVLVWAWLETSMSLQHVGLDVVLLPRPIICCHARYSLQQLCAHRDVFLLRIASSALRPLQKSVLQCERAEGPQDTADRSLEHVGSSGFHKALVTFDLRPWKKWITRLQIAQFTLSLPFALLVWPRVQECRGRVFKPYPPKVIHWIVVRNLRLEMFAPDKVLCWHPPQCKCDDERPKDFAHTLWLIDLRFIDFLR